MGVQGRWYTSGDGMSRHNVCIYLGVRGAIPALGTTFQPSMDSVKGLFWGDLGECPVH